MDPSTAAIIMGILNGLSGGIDAINAEKAGKLGIGESERQFNENLKTNRGQYATNVQRQLDESPLRDQLMYNVQQRVGMPMQRFQPRDMFNPTAAPTGAGGVNMGQLGQKISAYKPGMGGVNTDTLQRYLSALGYGPRPEQQPGNDAKDGFFRPFGTDQAHINPKYPFEQKVAQMGNPAQDRLRSMIPEFWRRFGFGG